MKQKILLGNTIIEYDLERKKVKNINLRIRSDGSIHLSASKSVPIERIESFMKEKSTLILSGLEKIKARRPLPTKEITYETGDVFMIGGVEYFLVVEIGEKNQVVLEENKIILTQKAARTPNLAHKRPL